ncbi:glycosyltransferase family 2 protein [Caballeronia sp. LZ016]|uniref:glycosyltransferase family 2 protein n=2 Tax=unclassified Caballeronia TaxID=2646786 RepID=UPI002860B457|nr:glycosyltransferase family 2 protein [Caballeronia sp. LZ016]MDR5740439.1 glycosyltransferase family 2 protein [Caballeronia sp. LZ016]
MSLHESVREAKPLLTIVVAAYNIEGYIEEALTSLLSQPHIDAMKIIVVDDGSTDETHAAAQAVAARDGGVHIEVIRQKNGGLSAARNTGLAAVRTPYVGFLDGDDIYLDGFTQAVIPRLAEGQYDILEYNVKIIDDDGRHLDDLELVSAGKSGAHRMDHHALRDFANTFHTFAWARVYRTEFFRETQFPVGRHYEDMAVIPSMYLRASRYYRVSEPLIGYRRRFGSITQKATLRDMRDLCINGQEALARCNGGDRDDFWLTVFDKVFERACHVCARVDRASFKQASQTLSQMAEMHRNTRAKLTGRSGREIVGLKPFDLNVRADRSVHFLKGLVKKVLRRSLDHRQRARRPSPSIG